VLVFGFGFVNIVTLRYSLDNALLAKPWQQPSWQQITDQLTERKETWSQATHGFWFLICYATTQLVIQLHQERIQVVRSNRVAWKRPAELNCTPAMDLGFDDIHKRNYTNKRGINTTHIHKHAVFRNSTYTKKELLLYCILLLYLWVHISLCFGMNPDYYHVVDLFG